MKKCCIVIPIYYDNPTIIDKKSLLSLNNLEDINNYDIKIICPNKIIQDKWSEILHSLNYKNGFEWVCFDNNYFISTTSYSKLLKTYSFWKTFEDYEYALIYQTDGYCFGGKLGNFFEDEYDYIGGIIISENTEWYHTPTCGNGGVSLRKVSSFLEFTNPDGECLKTIQKDIDETNTRQSNVYDLYEDLYFCQCLGRFWDIDICPNNKSVEFCVDMNADVVMAYMCKKLPLFAHAYDRNIRYWQTVVNDLNDITLISSCEWKYKDSNYKVAMDEQWTNKCLHPVYCGAVICVKNGNWCIDKCLDSLRNNGVQKILIIDNNENHGEQILLKDYSNVEVYRGFRGVTYEGNKNLCNDMHKFGYEKLSSEVDYILYIDADEVYEGNKTLSELSYIAYSNNSECLLLKSIIYDKDDNKTSYQKVNDYRALVKTNLNINVFGRNYPIFNWDKKEVNEDEAYIKNFSGCTSWEEYEKNKLYRGYYHLPSEKGKLMTNKEYYERINGLITDASTVSIG